MTSNIIIPRRKFIKSTCMALVGSCFLPKIVLGRSIMEKKFHLYQAQTGEYFKEVFWAEGKFIPQSLKLLNKFLRDWRTGSMIQISPQLLLLMHDIQRKMDAKKPLHILSAFRCAKTNNALRKKNRGVAKFSRHMTGHAVDFNIPGRALSQVRNCALIFKKGGVGYYPRSGFIHIDIRDKPARW